MSITLFQRRGGLLACAVAGLILAGWSLSGQAQVVCTTENWSDVEGVVAVGTPSNNNRRYGGPCGARVAATGNNYLVDLSPVGEATYNARFYAYLNALTGPAIIFEALDDGGDELIQVLFNVPSSGDLTLRVTDAGGGSNNLVFEDVGAGWHSIEFAWQGAADAAIRFAVNTSADDGADIEAELDTAGLSVHSARLGVINGADSAVGGTVDFDDFDSRRLTRPGRLCRGLTDESRDALTFQDAINIASDAVSPSTHAPGTPDYNEDGVVTFADAVAVANRAVSPSLRPCSQNR